MTKYQLFTPEMDKEIIKLYTQENLSIRAVAARVNRTYGSTHRRLKTLRVNLRPQGGGHNKGKILGPRYN